VGTHRKLSASIQERPTIGVVASATTRRRRPDHVVGYLPTANNQKTVPGTQQPPPAVIPNNVRARISLVRLL
jgi:hypothetical protein